jgi:hypothetical protein
MIRKTDHSAALAGSSLYIIIAEGENPKCQNTRFKPILVFGIPGTSTGRLVDD